MNKYGIKAVVCDLDGTVLTSKKKLLNETKHALIELQKQGITLILASSRSLFMLEEIIESLEMKKYGGFAVCQNGRVAVDLSTGEIQESPCIADDVSLRVFDHFKKHKDLGAFESERGFQIYLPFKLRWAMPLYYFLIAKKKYSEIRNITFEIFGDFRFSPEQKIEIIHKREELKFPNEKCGYIRLRKGMDQVITRLNQEFPELDTIQISRVWADMMPKGVNKAYGVNLLKDTLGYGFEAMMAFGDAENDIEMITSAKIGIAMGNAMDKVKACADDVTLTNNSNGIVHALKKYELID